MQNNPKIELGFLDIHDRSFSEPHFYPNIINVSFNDQQNIFDYIGKKVAQSDTGNRSMIFYSNKHPNIAFKISKEIIQTESPYSLNEKFRLSKVCPWFIQDLILRQSKIKNTKFPLGIVTIDNYPIAEIIPFFNNSITLKEFLQYQKKFVLPQDIYLNILYNLKELYDNDICYFDIHWQNFVIDINTRKVNIIDFGPGELFILQPTEDTYYLIKCSLAEMINKSNKLIGIDDNIDLNETNPIEDAIEKILKLSQKYK